MTRGNERFVKLTGPVESQTPPTQVNEGPGEVPGHKGDTGGAGTGGRALGGDGTCAMAVTGAGNCGETILVIGDGSTGEEGIELDGTEGRGEGIAWRIGIGDGDKMFLMGGTFFDDGTSAGDSTKGAATEGGDGAVTWALGEVAILLPGDGITETIGDGVAILLTGDGLTDAFGDGTIAGDGIIDTFGDGATGDGIIDTFGDGATDDGIIDTFGDGAIILFKGDGIVDLFGDGAITLGDGVTAITTFGDGVIATVGDGTTFGTNVTTSPIE